MEMISSVSVEAVLRFLTPKMIVTLWAFNNRRVLRLTDLHFGQFF